ncbi:hypothetical protein AG1IA_01616 [Rhizoctonia solani AG-1 IA]|uniref:Protein CPL1-like domain-containing protein n=1 Tax=Thanatephorus cucumeris (strain AG1-IA) TaxID=983506 RepID=L8X5R0_THACA|nr:hypothetical protein AG1IA_01616 [Rhizoctonia solani AG-1 IA]
MNAQRMLTSSYPIYEKIETNNLFNTHYTVLNRASPETSIGGDHPRRSGFLPMSRVYNTPSCLALPSFNNHSFDIPTHSLYLHTLTHLALASVMPICVTGKPSGGDGHPMLPVNPPHSGSIPGPSLWRRACQPAELVGVADRGITALAMGIGMLAQQTTSQRENECKAIQCGFRPSGGNVDGTGATGQTMCGEGYYSKGRSTTCTICPAGMYCNAQTTCDPKPCDPGTYADTPGAGQRCKDCPAGTFNNRYGIYGYGNTSCCNCCAGWFSQGNSRLRATMMYFFWNSLRNITDTHTNCERCPNIGEVQSFSVTGPVGSDSKDKLASSGRLRLARNHEPNPQEVAVCMRVSLEIVVDEAFGFIAATSGNTPSGAMTRSTTSTCPYGTTRREVKFGRGGFECVDILNSLETCGGCDNDCSSLEGTNEVQCIKGQCVVKSCAGGHELAIRGDGFARGGLDVGAHCVAKKRNHIRHGTDDMYWWGAWILHIQGGGGLYLDIRAVVFLESPFTRPYYYRLNFLQLRDGLVIELRSQCEPLVETDILVHIGLEDIEILQGRVSNVFNIVAEGRRDVAYDGFHQLTGKGRDEGEFAMSRRQRMGSVACRIAH